MASRIAERVRLANWIDDGEVAAHAIIDAPLPERTALDAYFSFPQRAEGFTFLNSFRERKRTCVNLDRLSPVLADITYAMQSPQVIEAVAELTGIPFLEPDPSLLRGGVSMMFKGDFLNPHIDNSHGPEGAGYRRLNLLYYVTPDWGRQDGGSLELWDTRVRRRIDVEARFNRLIIMGTDRRSWHSVSPILVDRPRCCVSNYFFTKASPEAGNYYHVTSFTGRPGQVVRRILAPVDNAARQFAKTRLRANRRRNRGFQAATQG